MRKLLMLTVAVAFVAFAACKAKTAETAQPNPDEVTTSTSEKEVAGVQAPGDLSPAEAQARIDDVTIGHELGPDGAILAGTGGDDFAPGQPIYLAMEVGDTPAGSAVKVVWFAPGETRIGEETKTVATGSKYLNFNAGNTAGWAKGDYRVEVWIGDEKVNTQQFQIVDKSEAGK